MAHDPDVIPSTSRPMRARGPSRGTFQLSLPPKTFAGFVAAFIAVFAIAVLTYRTLDARTEGALHLTQTVEALQQLEAVLSTVKDAETGQRGFLLTGGEERYLAPYSAAVVALPGVLDAARRAVANDPAQLQRIDALARIATDKLAELKETIDLRRAGHPEAALAIVLTDRGKNTMDEARTLTAEAMRFERLQLEQRTRQWDESTTVSAAIVWGGSGLLLFLIGAAVVASSRDFRDQQVHSWLRQGQTDLANQIQGNQHVDKIGDKIASFLAEYLGAQVGAVYFAAGAGELRSIAAYAAPPDAPERAAAGGLTVQAMRDNRILEVRDLPEDYFSVTSGLGRTKAGHLVVAPASADGIPNAVVELGFFQPILPEGLELLRLAAEPIGVALRSAKYRKDVEDLLEETQRQAEELQTQQEELRVNNEELEQQGRTLQVSQEQLKNQQAELEQINSELEEQTQALEHQRDDLVRAKSDLERTSAYKSEFLANMSHELRTPLNSLLILAKLLADNREANLNEEQIKFAQTIYSAGNDLLTLINDILDLAKVEAGQLDVVSESVPVRRLLDDLVGTCQPIARERGLALDTSIDSAVPAAIETDRTRIQQILKNLLSNALKFTQHGGVGLHVRRAADGRVAFDVTDTGIGIAPEQHEVVFQAFRQADGTTNRKYGGTGLGLSISRDLARLLGGELTVASTLGRGSTFTLVLPERYAAPQNVARPPSEATAPLPGRSPGANGKGSSRPAAPRVAVSAPAANDRKHATPGSRTILVIEDDIEFARIIQTLAGELDFQTVLAMTAEQGLELAERDHPSAIVLDVGLPDRSGLSVLDALKHNSKTRHIPVHVISASDYTQEALEMGAAGYAIKPVKREQLVQALQRLETKFTQKLRRVLVVEDDATLRESTCRLLSGDDVETFAVGTAAEALDHLRATTFDCMVLDLSLPDQTGFQLLESMSHEEQSSYPPVIVYTGRSLSRDEEQQLRRFSHSIIVKGARSPERLLDEVTLFLHRVESDLPPDRQRMLRDARHREAVFEGRRVLVVEDDVRNIFALSSVFEPKGAKVDIARNGLEALAYLRDKPGVDLVLMDVMMPEMDGLEAMREIRKQPALAKLPIIALTAKAMSDDRENCLAAGANDYIAKPLDVDKLLSLARVWMLK
jgi:CheY-like chemotaxis protein/CHASE3 domain sensor protein